MAAVSKRTWTHGGETKSAWVVRYRTPGGAHKQKTFERKRDADTYRVKIEGEMQRDLHVFSPVLMRDLIRDFGKLTDDRVETGQIGWTRAEALNGYVNRHILPAFGHRLTTEITALDIEDWARGLLRGGNVVNGKPLSTYTVIGILSAMKSLEDFAIKRGRLKVRICGDARKSLGTLKRAPVRSFTVAELQQLLNAVHAGAQGRGPRDRTILACYVYLAAFCGLRLGEINALAPDAIDFHRNVIKIRHSMTNRGEIKGPKTAAGVRDVPMPAMVADLLTVWLRDHLSPNALGVMFTTRTGEPMYRIDWNRRWLKVRAQAGLTDGRSLRFHALRHFAASFMIQHQIPLTDVARLMGHETFDTTLQVYAHPVYDHDRFQSTMNNMVAAVPVLPSPERWASGQRIPLARIEARARAQEARIAENTQ